MHYNRFLRLGLCFSMFFGWVWLEMENIAEDELAGDGG
jgi:hypothetical protein